MNQTNNKPETIQVTQAEKEILEDLRKMVYGRITIFVQNGKPFRKEVTEYRKLNKEGKFCAEREQSKPKSIEI